MIRRKGVIFFVLISVAAGFELLAQSPEIPNWTVPPYRGTSPSAGLSTMTDISPGVAFVAMSPCRVFDTRNANGPYGGPRLLGNTTRIFDIDSGPCTGIPTGVDAYSMNFGAILPDGANSFVTIWPTGSAQPLVSSINPIQGGVVANAAIVPAGTNGSISVFPNTGMHLYGDINGYFSDRMGGTNQFEVRAGGGTAIFGENTGSGYGVWGISATGYGVVAGGGAGGVWATTNGVGASGVYGQHTGSGYGVYGKSVSGFGVRGQTDSGLEAAGVYGIATAASELVYGVFGEVVSSVFSSAGVFGKSAHGYGVLGIGGYEGVQGVGDTYGVRGVVTSGFNEGYLAAFGYGVYAGGGFAGTGAKYFVEPHPKRADLVIRYVSLEGNESGTYFRGRGRFQNGLATIEVPEDFRLVTDSEGLSVVATPIGLMATVSVASIDLDKIVLRGSRNVEFFYIVNGVRKTHRHLTPIGPGREFMPESPDSKMPLYLTEGQREMLISNGTYKLDGTVNMETARRLGWDKEWEKRGRPTPQPTAE